MPLRDLAHRRSRIEKTGNVITATGTTAATLTTGIRLNWRLIGAPDYVADYICIHELCHLPHHDHSPQFWATVNRLTPHTQAAEKWLKAHGRELFALG